MQYAMVDGKYLLKIERGESVVATINNFCRERSIMNALFSGIGAVDWLQCGYYARSEKKYYFTDYDELLEVVSLTGNVMVRDSEPFVHVHGVFTNTKNEALGGHVAEMRVGVVLEVVLEPLPSHFTRRPDTDIGLALMDLPESYPGPNVLTDDKR